MDYIVSALRQNPELAIFLTIAIGFLIGRVRFGSFSLGIVVGCLLAGGARSSWGTLDIALHSIAFAPKDDLQAPLAWPSGRASFLNRIALPT